MRTITMKNINLNFNPDDYVVEYMSYSRHGAGVEFLIKHLAYMLTIYKRPHKICDTNVMLRELPYRLRLFPSPIEKGLYSGVG